jgi:hypothetical protein
MLSDRLCGLVFRVSGYRYRGPGFDSSVWYLAQIFPIQEKHIRQINSAIAYFLWKGEIFRVPLSTLQREKKEGGWGLVDLAAKCRSLFLLLYPKAMVGWDCRAEALRPRGKS